MWDTYKMWKMMRILKKYQHSWAHSDYKAKENETKEERDERFIAQIMEISARTLEPDVISTQLALAYIQQNSWFGRKELPVTTWKKPMDDLIRAKSVILDCRAKGFVEYTQGKNGIDIENPNHLVITLDGKKFATLEGLLKEWISDDIGILQSTIVPPILVFIGAINWDLIKRLTSVISSWW